MKTLVRAVCALSLVAVATPAFPCGDMKQTTASTATPTAKKTDKQAVAKSDAKKTSKKAETKATN